MSLHVYTGCMASSKTTSNIKDATMFLDVLKYKGLFIHNCRDTRDTKNIVSSNSSSFHGISPAFEIITVNNLEEADSKVSEYNIISIDEFHFYSNPTDIIIKWLAMGKHLFVSGLNSDWKGNDEGGFSNIKNLLHLATSFTVLHAKCYFCAEECLANGNTNVTQISDACRTGKISGSKEQIEVGGIGTYVPLCYKHHQELLK